MAAVNGVVSEGEKGGPPPPSPLTGCYLLIVIGEPHSKEHKDIILQRVAKGLLSWDVNDCLVDLEKELAIITEQSPEGEEARYGERLIQFASENLVTEVLIHPVVSTLAQCVRNLLSSFTRHRHIIHAGYTFATNGSWILQDGTFSLADFSEAFQEIEVQRVIRAYENGISMDIHCSPEGDWNSLPKESFARYCKIRINPNDVLTSGSPSISNFIDYISPFLIPAEIETLLESSDVVGNIRFSHPTLYVFPGGQGDAALFGINGFNMLLDGGFSRKSCFWDFVRHLDRLDAVLLTRLNNSNVNGISAVLRRKRQNAVYPQIGHFFCNIPDKKAVLSPDGDKDKDPLLINILEEGHEIISNLQHLSLTPQSCFRDSEPINLYHKVGHGTLDMYVLSPARDSKEVREFMQKWNNNDQKLFSYPKSNKEFTFPVQNLVSICALLVWQPANPEDNITRILYPGSSPQQKIFEGLDKIKHLGCTKHPVCSENSLTRSVSATALKAKSIIDRIVPEQKTTKKVFENKQKDKLTKEADLKSNKIIENGETPEIIEKQIKKSDSTEGDKIASKVQKPKKLDTEKEATEKTEDKLKTKPKETKVDAKVKQRSESQQRKSKAPEKKASPTTPKKTIDSKINGETPKPKPTGKASPHATPAKSAKEASNRKVVESKYKQTAKPPSKPVPEKKEVKQERKPITRRAKETPASKPPSSPLKKVNGVAKNEAATRKARLDKEGTTDSSTVSTPSADQESILKKDISKLTPEELEKLKAQELADLKEEQEVVKEIEAVFRKGEVQGEKYSDMRKIKDLSVEEKEKEEYLVIEKEEIIHETVDTKEDETQKLTRDSEESEKQKVPEKAEIEPKESKEVVVEVVSTEVIKPAESAVDLKEKVTASKEGSIASPEEKVDTSSERKTNDRDVENVEIVESQPDEKVSGNLESGATTTAPTLPEDERIPLDEIKEDNGDQVIEEKYVKEETKEKDIPVVQLPPKPLETIPKLPPVVGIRLDKQSNIRDLVKTPDEVADLPVHEEVDIHHYEEYHITESGKEITQDEKLHEKYERKEEGEKAPAKEELETKDLKKGETVTKDTEVAKVEEQVKTEEVKLSEKTEELETKADLKQTTERDIAASIPTQEKSLTLQEKVLIQQELDDTKMIEKEEKQTKSDEVKLVEEHKDKQDIEAEKKVDSAVLDKRAEKPEPEREIVKLEEKVDFVAEGELKPAADIEKHEEKLLVEVEKQAGQEKSQTAEQKTEALKGDKESVLKVEKEISKEEEQKEKAIPDIEKIIDAAIKDTSKEVSDIKVVEKEIASAEESVKEAEKHAETKKTEVIISETKIAEQEKEVVAEDANKVTPPIITEVDKDISKEKLQEEKIEHPKGIEKTEEIVTKMETEVTKEESKKFQDELKGSEKTKEGLPDVEEDAAVPLTSSIDTQKTAATEDEIFVKQEILHPADKEQKTEEQLIQPVLPSLEKESVVKDSLKKGETVDLDTTIKGTDDTKREDVMDVPKSDILKEPTIQTSAIKHLQEEVLTDDVSVTVKPEDEMKEEPIKASKGEDLAEQPKSEQKQEIMPDVEENTVALKEAAIEKKEEELIKEVKPTVTATIKDPDDTRIRESFEKTSGTLKEELEESKKHEEELTMRTKTEKTKEASVGESITNEETKESIVEKADLEKKEKESDTKLDETKVETHKDEVYISKIVEEKSNEPMEKEKETVEIKIIDSIESKTGLEEKSKKELLTTIEKPLLESQKESISIVDSKTETESVIEPKHGETEKGPKKSDTFIVDKKQDEKIVDITGKSEEEAFLLQTNKLTEVKKEPKEATAEDTREASLNAASSPVIEKEKDFKPELTNEKSVEAVFVPINIQKEELHDSGVEGAAILGSAKSDIDEAIIKTEEKKVFVEMDVKSVAAEMAEIKEQNGTVVSAVQADICDGESVIDEKVEIKTKGIVTAEIIKPTKEEQASTKEDVTIAISEPSIEEFRKDALQDSKETILKDEPKGVSEAESIAKQDDEKLIMKAVQQNTQQVAEVDKKLQELKSKIGEVPDVTSTERKASFDEVKDTPLRKSAEFIDKAELGSKSPKEREEDVAKIVATVAEVLKSDAPLEELEEKVLISGISPFSSYTTQLRETHITTQDSPAAELIKESDEKLEMEIPTEADKKSITSTFLDEERKTTADHTERTSSLIQDSKELMQQTSKIIADIKSGKVESAHLEKTESTDSGTVHRMLVTASSEDGGEETVICPVGSITFSRSSESSGRSSPEIQSDSQSTVKSSIDLRTSESELKKVEPGVLEDKGEDSKKISPPPSDSSTEKSQTSKEPIDTIVTKVDENQQKEDGVVKEHAGEKVDAFDAVLCKSSIIDDAQEKHEKPEKRDKIEEAGKTKEFPEEAHDVVVETIAADKKQVVEKEEITVVDDEKETLETKSQDQTMTDEIDDIKHVKAEETLDEKKKEKEKGGLSIELTQSKEVDKQEDKGQVEEPFLKEDLAGAIQLAEDETFKKIELESAKEVKTEVDELSLKARKTDILETDNLKDVRNEKEKQDVITVKDAEKHVSEEQKEGGIHDDVQIKEQKVKETEQKIAKREVEQKQESLLKQETESEHMVAKEELEQKLEQPQDKEDESVKKPVEKVLEQKQEPLQNKEIESEKKVVKGELEQKEEEPTQKKEAETENKIVKEELEKKEDPSQNKEVKTEDKILKEGLKQKDVPPQNKEIEAEKVVETEVLQQKREPQQKQQIDAEEDKKEVPSENKEVEAENKVIKKELEQQEQQSKVKLDLTEEKNESLDSIPKSEKADTELSTKLEKEETKPPIAVSIEKIVEDGLPSPKEEAVAVKTESEVPKFLQHEEMQTIETKKSDVKGKISDLKKEDQALVESAKDAVKQDIKQIQEVTEHRDEITKDAKLTEIPVAEALETIKTVEKLETAPDKLQTKGRDDDQASKEISQVKSDSIHEEIISKTDLSMSVEAKKQVESKESDQKAVLIEKISQETTVSVVDSFKADSIVKEADLDKKDASATQPIKSEAKEQDSSETFFHDGVKAVHDVIGFVTDKLQEKDEVVLDSQQIMIDKVDSLSTLAQGAADLEKADRETSKVEIKEKSVDEVPETTGASAEIGKEEVEVKKDETRKDSVSIGTEVTTIDQSPAPLQVDRKIESCPSVEVIKLVEQQAAKHDETETALPPREKCEEIASKAEMKVAPLSVAVDTDAAPSHKEDAKAEDFSLASDLSDSAGPSRRKDSIASHLSPSKTSTEDLNLSGKSTPDIADVERMKEMQEILKHEKHIPGSSTPPTVPVSPVIKDEGEYHSTKTDMKKSTDTSPLSSLKDVEARSITPASDDYERSDISSGQASRAPNVLDIERNDSEEDIPGSPNSVTSQLAHSHSTLQYEFEDSAKIHGKIDPMNVSFYGALPDEPVGERFLDEADMDFEKAMHEHRQARGEDLGRDVSSSYLFEVTKAKYSASGSSGPSSIQEECFDSKKKDDLMTSSFIGELPSTEQDQAQEDPLKIWGKPLGLPSPAPPSDNKGTPKKERKLPAHVTAKNKINDDRKRAESPSKYKQKKTNAVYVDLTYVPHHGNSNYSYVDFFKRVRARYYVFSGIEPSKEVYNALLEAKQTWEDKDLEVTIIPTYDTDILGYWVAENEDLLAKHKIDLSPSASRCTINLQDHETSCSAYRLEF